MNSISILKLFLVASMPSISMIFSMPSLGAVVTPTAHNITLDITMDRDSLPSSVKVFDNILGGQSDPSQGANSGMINYNRNNTLVCRSRTDTATGACPTNPYWGNGKEGPLMAGSLVLRFTQQGTGKTIDLTLEGIKRTPPYQNISLWNAVGNDSGRPLLMSASISRAELSKLTPGNQAWKAKLIMNMTQWSNNCHERYDVNIGCPGYSITQWTADITLKVTDYGTQQIYFSNYSGQNPVIDLGLKINNNGTSSATASARKTVDMCLYDGNNSASSQISMLFRDEGKTSQGREAGLFSIYRPGGESDPASRLDYSLSVVNPKTGQLQPITNGLEIVWTGVSANEGMVKTRTVKLPGISGLVQCVPAPLTFSIPASKLSSKTPGKYTGKLNVTYTPTTQSMTDYVPR
ncbi:CfaE/CblD family pilus tip adhesin [uncultured Pluralibacter sp.]|uniref:CfaE/CblD family pilus tip adhesin n=1 Tax=uncultured Pluralibacter sp. TaxID=1490864 RepID=UPI0026022996|nr:CfaE/CblD family pilus tip adhesin [uncultured Pluralibacter sp.]